MLERGGGDVYQKWPKQICKFHFSPTGKFLIGGGGATRSAFQIAKQRDWQGATSGRGFVGVFRGFCVSGPGAAQSRRAQHRCRAVPQQASDFFGRHHPKQRFASQAGGRTARSGATTISICDLGGRPLVSENVKLTATHAKTARAPSAGAHLVLQQRLHRDAPGRYHLVRGTQGAPRRGVQQDPHGVQAAPHGGAQQRRAPRAVGGVEGRPEAEEVERGLRVVGGAGVVQWSVVLVVQRINVGAALTAQGGARSSLGRRTLQ